MYGTNIDWFPLEGNCRAAEQRHRRSDGERGRRFRRDRRGRSGRHRPSPAHHQRNDDGLHERLLGEHQPGEGQPRQRCRAGPHRGGPTDGGLFDGVPVGTVPQFVLQAIDHEEKVPIGDGLQAGTQGGQNAGHHYGGVRVLLVAVLHHRHPTANVHRLRHQPADDERVPLVGLLQLDAQSDHLHDLQPGVPARLQADTVRPEAQLEADQAHGRAAYAVRGT